jgi:hypothetical protein
MKAFLIIVFIMNISCKSSYKDHLSDVCSRGNFSVEAEKVALTDSFRIKELHGRFVEIEGILHYNFEDVALYPSKHSDVIKAMWLNLIIPDKVSEMKIKRMDGVKVVLIGKIDTTDQGHYDAYIATLDSAFCIKVK